MGKCLKSVIDKWFQWQTYWWFSVPLGQCCKQLLLEAEAQSHRLYSFSAMIMGGNTWIKHCFGLRHKALSGFWS